MNDKLLRTCKQVSILGGPCTLPILHLATFSSSFQASEAYLVSNLDEAVFYYQEALATSTQSEAVCALK